MRIKSSITDTDSPFTSVYGLARSLLALCTLLAFVGHSADELFFHYPGYADLLHEGSLGKFSLFYLLRDHILIAQGVSIIVLLAVIVGWRPRVTGVLHWYVSASFAASCLLVQGGDHVVANLTLILLPVTLLDGRRFHWNEPAAGSAPAGSLRRSVVESCFIVAKIQVAVIYFFAGVTKLGVTEWANGTAFYYWFSHPVFGAPDWLRVAIGPLLVLRPVVLAITWGTIAFEVFLAAGLITKERFKPVMLVVGLFFHMGIVFIHGLLSFFFAMAGALVIYLVKPTYHVRFGTLAKTIKRQIVLRRPRISHRSTKIATTS